MTTSAAPVIGLSTYVETTRWGIWERECAMLPMTYVNAVSRAGGTPLLLPPALDAESALARMDGLILTGGPDIAAALYGQEQHPQADPPRAQRDEWESQLLAAAMARRTPVLGICRGMQLLNLAAGGDLVQDIADPLRASLHRAAPGQFGTHAVRLAEGSWCRDVLGGVRDVATYHHQAVRQLGDGLRAVAWSDDGCVEAIEAEQALQIGVQWHPEEDKDSDLVRAFVERCRRQGDDAGEPRAAAMP